MVGDWTDDLESRPGEYQGLSYSGRLSADDVVSHRRSVLVVVNSISIGKESSQMDSRDSDFCVSESIGFGKSAECCFDFGIAVEHRILLSEGEERGGKL